MKIEKGKKGRKRKEGEDYWRIVQCSMFNLEHLPHHLRLAHIPSSRYLQGRLGCKYYLNRRNHIIYKRASPWIPNPTSGTCPLSFQRFLNLKNLKKPQKTLETSTPGNLCHFSRKPLFFKNYGNLWKPGNSETYIIHLGLYILN